MKKVLFGLFVISLFLLSSCGSSVNTNTDDTTDGDNMMGSDPGLDTTPPSVEGNGDSLDSNIDEIGELEGELVDPNLENDLDNINLDDW